MRPLSLPAVRALAFAGIACCAVAIAMLSKKMRCARLDWPRMPQAAPSSRSACGKSFWNERETRTARRAARYNVFRARCLACRDFGGLTSIDIRRAVARHG